VTGSVSNVVDDNGDALSGSLALGGSRLDRSGNPANDATLLVGASGTLTDSAGRDLIVGTQLEGDFLANALAGTSLAV